MLGSGIIICIPSPDLIAAWHGPRGHCLRICLRVIGIHSPKYSILSIWRREGAAVWKGFSVARGAVRNVEGPVTPQKLPAICDERDDNETAGWKLLTARSSQSQSRCSQPSLQSRSSIITPLKLCLILRAVPSPRSLGSASKFLPSSAFDRLRGGGLSELLASSSSHSDGEEMTRSYGSF